MITDKNKAATEFIRLIEIMEMLRSPEGCPWDREQTPDSLKSYLLEETYELLDALDNGLPGEICDELGDLLLQIVFLTELHREQGLFDLTSVAATINKKMIRRHPHVFGQEKAENHADRWEQIKKQERSRRGLANTLTEQITDNLPALKKAAKTAKKTDLISSINIIDNLTLALQELKNQINKSTPSDKNNFFNDLGNMLYSMAELCTSLNLDAEDILRVKTKQVIASIDDQNSSELTRKITTP